MSKSLTYGGEAVFDGVMMRGQRVWSLAVRLPDGSIRVEVKPVPAWMSFARRVPLVRGMVSLLASVVLGTRALQESLSFRDDSRDVASLKNRLLTVVSALLIVGAFLMIPLWIAKALVPESSAVVFSVVEAVSVWCCSLVTWRCLALRKTCKRCLRITVPSTKRSTHAKPVKS